jgi:peroxiredoxin
LADFQLRLSRLEQLGAKVIAFTAESKEKAALMIQRHELTYPVVFGLDPEDMTQKIGCSISLEEPIRLEPTGIVLRPDGTIAWSVYASGAIGRLTADDTAAIMDFYQKKGW